MPPSIPLDLLTNIPAPPDSLKQLDQPLLPIMKTLPASYTGIACGVVATHPTSITPKILLVQRAAHDSHPNEWEVPGGAVDDTDSSFLDAAARELWEEAGLKVKRWIGPVGSGKGAEGEDEVVKKGGYAFTTSKGKRIIKFHVEAEVLPVEEGEVLVKLDPEEHQDYVWAGREEIERGECEGRKLVFTAEGQKWVAMEGLKLKEDRIARVVDEL
jgi:8-oxo-dGTP pyrophosphatase MutT (NUDIX family)